MYHLLMKYVHVAYFQNNHFNFYCLLMASHLLMDRQKLSLLFVLLFENKTKLLPMYYLLKNKTWNGFKLSIYILMQIVTVHKCTFAHIYVTGPLYIESIIIKNIKWLTPPNFFLYCLPFFSFPNGTKIRESKFIWWK